MQTTEHEEPGLDAIAWIHRDEPVLVAGCGPSLAEGDLSRFAGMTSLGSNSVGQIFAPTYYSIFDPFSFRHLAKLFYRTESTHILPPWINGPCDYRIGYEQENEIGLSRTTIYSGRTSGFLNLALAYIMGAKEIHVIGIDGYDQPNLYATDVPQEYHAKSREKWTPHRADLVRTAWTTAASVLTGEGIRLVSWSTGAMLRGIPGIEQQA